MKLLDKYLLRRFVGLLLYSMIAFIAIFLVVDVVENMDKFIDANLTKYQIFIYYTLNIPFFISTALPMSMLIASVFSIGVLNRNNEISAMKASGLSLYRIATPLLLLSLLISTCSFFFDDQVTVHTNRHLDEYKKQYIKKEPPRRALRRDNIFIQDTRNRNLIIQFFNGQNMTGREASIQYLENGRLVKRIDAKTILWDDSTKTWKVANYVVREFPSADSEKVVASSPNTMQVALTVRPNEILKESIDPAQMDYAELSGFIHDLQRIGIDPRKWEVNLHFKVAFAFTNFVVVLFGLPLMAIQKKGGLAFGAGLSIFVIFIYYAFIKVGQVMGFKGMLPPLLSVWVGNIVFIVSGIILLIKTPK